MSLDTDEYYRKGLETKSLNSATKRTHVFLKADSIKKAAYSTSGHARNESA